MAKTNEKKPKKTNHRKLTAKDLLKINGGAAKEVNCYIGGGVAVHRKN